MTDETIEMHLNQPAVPPGPPVANPDVMSTATDPDAASTTSASAQVERLVNSLVGPAAGLLRDLTSTAAQVFQTLLEAEYERGRHAGLTEAAERAERARAARPSPTVARPSLDLALSPRPNGEAMATFAADAQHRAGQKRRAL